ncbi:hypothetical protein LCGC14_2686750 [marine sediment metagenome]|uniref:SMODS and SLOG-associating 2TM effector domain-containing protein n=1 Tax=marine sediment metagenome TaxID=412755 RepID=A0A0F9BUG1_9ZZZZ
MSDLDNKHSDLLFGVRRSVRYHSRRLMFFDRWHKVTSGINVVFGSAALMTILARWPHEITAFAALMVTLFSTIDLIVGHATAARRHQDLYRSFIELEKDIISETLDVNQGTVRRLSLEAEEPPIKRILDTICHNDLARSMGYDASEMWRVKWYQRWPAQFFDIGLDSIRRVGSH